MLRCVLIVRRRLATDRSRCLEDRQWCYRACRKGGVSHAGRRRAPGPGVSRRGIWSAADIAERRWGNSRRAGPALGREKGLGKGRRVSRRAQNP
jgi:hypothetical protein